MFDAHLFFSTFFTLFVILDPPGLLPVFLGLTRRHTPAERASIAWRATLVALGVIVGFAVFGRQILSYLHITVASLQVSGGLLLALVAYQMLMGQSDGEINADATARAQVSVVPLGIPLLAGPGSIVAMMLAVDRAHDTLGYVTVGGALAAAMLAVWLFLRFASVIRRVLGDAGTTLLSRVAGMLLAAIAVQMVVDGVLEFVAQAS
ncbi:MarC family protein [Nigerium sp.]|uniref:MarC family protein n=1 Tax=Nigerium sp. TaxID=2042655 RepID=UPI003221F39E